MRRVAAVVVGALRLEWRVYVGVARLLARRGDVPPGATAHPYVGGSAAVLWAFTAVSAVELVALHLIIPWEGVRLSADVLGIWGVLWCLGYTGCHYVYPHLATSEGLVVRHADRRAVVVVPWDAVRAVAVRETSHDSSRGVQVVDRPEGGRTVVVGGSRTNVHVQLRRPLVAGAHRFLGTTSHEVDAVSLVADDPRAVAATWREHRKAGSETR